MLSLVGVDPDRTFTSPPTSSPKTIPTVCVPISATNHTASSALIRPRAEPISSSRLPAPTGAVARGTDVGRPGSEEVAVGLAGEFPQHEMLSRTLGPFYQRERQPTIQVVEFRRDLLAASL